MTLYWRWLTSDTNLSCKRIETSRPPAVYRRWSDCMAPFVVNVEMAWTFVITVPILAVVSLDYLLTIPMYHARKTRSHYASRAMKTYLVCVTQTFTEKKRNSSFLEKIPKRWIKRNKGGYSQITHYVCDWMWRYRHSHGGAIKVDTGT